MNRRDFLRTASGAAVIAAGPTVSVSARPSDTTTLPPSRWDDFWRPDTPCRLSETTRRLAARAISGEHGRAMARATFALDPAAVADLSPDMRYARAVQLVAEQAPLRVLPSELIVGSATLLEAPAHLAPLADVHSTSHTTLGFAQVLRSGYRGLRQRIEDRLAREPQAGVSPTPGSGGADLLEAMLVCLDAAAVWHRRYMDLLDERIAASDGVERETYTHTRDALRNVPENPPETFHEAVQSLWFMYAFQRLMGTWSGIGRIDEMLGPHLERDLEAGRLTLDEAREILAHFWIKGCEWIGAFDTRGSGDAQHYQNVILAGVDPTGREVTNAVTYLVLDIVEELHISDFPIAVRLNRNTPRRLLRRMAEVQRHGGGIVAAYNEDVAIEALTRFGYPVEEARTFANDGCWEMLVPGRTAFIYVPFDALGLLHGALGLHDPAQPAPDFPDFETCYAAFRERLAAHLDGFHQMADQHWTQGPPAPLVSMFVEDCIERAQSYYARGARYNVIAPHAGGLANVANSLLVIKRLVYEDRYLTLPEFVEVLRSDWDGHEHLRQLVLNRFTFYGNDDDEADAMVRRVFDDYTALAGQVRDRNGVLRPTGISTFGREIEWSFPEGPRRASPDGYKRGAVLATNFSPSPGTDLQGPTAVLQSYCKMDFTKTPNCATVELKVHPESVKDERGLDAMVALLESFVRLGGMFMHVDVVDSAMLIDAQRHPEKYPNFAVRIAGWSARFATLDKHWQDMVIQRTQQRV
ncbi:MAG TPA: pyruvate formate lyase family protein [Candidatus Hydrogenedentes bacterium]|nr:pyruvate formate lyase family protein [Candidatus Hydrogenedentota bacterium]